MRIRRTIPDYNQLNGCSASPSGCYHVNETSYLWQFPR